MTAADDALIARARAQLDDPEMNAIIERHQARQQAAADVVERAQLRPFLAAQVAARNAVHGGPQRAYTGTGWPEIVR